MQIEDLFDVYEQQFPKTLEIENVFEESKMVNRFNELDYGFFPLGSGILNSKSKTREAEITNCNIMVLGNDFGTQEYIENKCHGKKEKETNSTIYNLFSLELNKETTFFTNLFMGLRTGKEMIGTKDMKSAYEKFCLDLVLFNLQSEICNLKSEISNLKSQTEISN